VDHYQLSKDYLKASNTGVDKETTLQKAEIHAILCVCERIESTNLALSEMSETIRTSLEIISQAIWNKE